jgi:hypothetical protein
MVSSHSFGSTPLNILLRPFGLAFAVAPPATGLTLLKRVTRRPVLQKVRHHAFTRLMPVHSTLTVCKHMVSGSISFPSRGAFHLSLTVLVHYRSPGCLALESGLPSFPPGSSCPVVLRIPGTVPFLSTTGLSPATAGLSMLVRLVGRFLTVWDYCRAPTRSFNSFCATPAGYHTQKVWAFPGSFATTTGIVSFPRGT